MNHVFINLPIGPGGPGGPLSPGSPYWVFIVLFNVYTQTHFVWNDREITNKNIFHQQFKRNVFFFISQQWRTENLIQNIVQTKKNMQTQKLKEQNKKQSTLSKVIKIIQKRNIFCHIDIIIIVIIFYYYYYRNIYFAHTQPLNV